MNERAIAKICHEANKAYCEELGDFSQMPWDMAPDWQKESAVNGVKMHLSGEFSAEESHANWLKEKVAAGWTWGPVKNQDLLQHPCIMSYEDLPEEQRVKDKLFRAVVSAFKEIE